MQVGAPAAFVARPSPLYMAIAGNCQCPLAYWGRSLSDFRANVSQNVFLLPQLGWLRHIVLIAGDPP
ncbi:hypothetical protein LF95_01735 [Thalassospira sp. TSL5-1]|nr:hypothetical protein LF95_01735 [Thalassospira sp. TSL5-1]